MSKVKETLIDIHKRKGTGLEVIEASLDAMIEQGKVSQDDLGNCCYGNADGCKCAVGLLLPEDCNLFDVIGNVGTLIQVAGELEGRTSDLFCALRKYKNELRVLQTLHDTGNNVAILNFLEVNYPNNKYVNMEEIRDKVSKVVAFERDPTVEDATPVVTPDQLLAIDEYEAYDDKIFPDTHTIKTDKLKSIFEMEPPAAVDIEDFINDIDPPVFEGISTEDEEDEEDDEDVN